MNIWESLEQESAYLRKEDEHYSSQNDPSFDWIKLLLKKNFSYHYENYILHHSSKEAGHTYKFLRNSLPNPPRENNYEDEVFFRLLRELRHSPKPPQEHQEDLKETIQNLKSELEEVKAQIDSIGRDNLKLKEIIYDDLISHGSNKKIQLLPVEIYVDSEEPEVIFSIYDSVLSFLDIIGLDKTIELPAIRGSWYKRLVAKTREIMTDDEVFDRLKEVEYGLEANLILAKQAEIDKNQSEALLNIINSISSTHNAAIRIGSLVVVKTTDPSTGVVNIQTITLTIKELHLLNKHPELMRNPAEILLAVAKSKEEDGQMGLLNKN